MVGPYAELVDARSPQNVEQSISVGLKKEVYLQHTRLGLKSAKGQFYGIVLPGLTTAMHCFRGLMRPLMLGVDMNADQSVAIYAWKPQDNYEWVGDTPHGTIARLDPPLDQVFVVLVREQPTDDQGASGVILRWYWIREDPMLAGAPVDWQIRFGKKLWSREAQ
jgi:hypothetical protein